MAGSREKDRMEEEIDRERGEEGGFFCLVLVHYFLSWGLDCRCAVMVYKLCIS